MKGRRGGDLETVPYLSALEARLGRMFIHNRDVGGTTATSSSSSSIPSSGPSLRHRIGTMLRSSALGSACSMTSRNVSDAVQEPVFVSSRRISGDFRRLERLPSTASTAISSASNGAAAADPRRGLLAPRHRRSQSTGGSGPGGGMDAVDLGICRPARKERKGVEGGGKVVIPPFSRPAMVMMPPVGRSMKQAGGISLIEKQRQQQPRPQPRPLPAPMEASSNGSHNDSRIDKFGRAQLSLVAAAGAKNKKKKGKGKVPAGRGGVRLSSNPYGFTSSSSGQSDGGGQGCRDDALSSTDEEEEEEEDYHDTNVTLVRRRREDETETVFSSSRSLSSDSTAGMESSYYYRSSRSSSGSRRRKKAQQRQVVSGGIGKYSTVRGGGMGMGIGIGGIGRAAGSSRLDLDDGFRPLISISSSTSHAGTASIATAAAATSVTVAACSSATTTTTSTREESGSGRGSTSGSTSSSPSSSSQNKGEEEEEELSVRAHRADVELGLSHPQKKQSQSKSDGVAKTNQQQQGKLFTGSVWKDVLLTADPSKEASTVTGEVDEEEEEDGYAVVKESSDPYSDFRSSALEMIMERQLFGAVELERLLGAFLSLNDPCHHPVILHVFSEIWQALFDNS